MIDNYKPFDDSFQIHSYGRAELAMIYFPNVSAMAAWRHLKKSIEYYPGLTDKLQSIGYKPKSRSFTSAQVQAIVDAIGEP